jgi:protein ImuB
MPERGRMVVKAANTAAQAQGVQANMVVADCRAILPSLQVLNDRQGRAEKLLTAIAEWSMRYTPRAAVDLPDGIMLDVSGCPHLWGGELPYLNDILTKLRRIGYDVQGAMADTVGMAWAVSRFGKATSIIETGRQVEALLSLPPAALRLDAAILQRLHKLGLHQIRNFISMPRSALRRRFGQQLLTRLDQALGQEIEIIEPLHPIEPYQERLPCLEPIRSAVGIEIVLKRLLEILCSRLSKDEKGLRKCIFKAYRVDSNIQQIDISTGYPSHNAVHLFKLFENKIAALQPDLGFELFIMVAPTVENMPSVQDVLWSSTNHNDVIVTELLDRITNKIGRNTINRYLPVEHHWPEWSIKPTSSLQEKATTDWRTDLPRPIHLLTIPEEIVVTVPIPDYPPMLFKYNGQLHNISKSEGPERIEREWWIDDGLYRDYYCVEDEAGARYWLFRLGSYNDSDSKWFIHGFFA